VQSLLIRHILDVMHCEKNLCENMVKTIFGRKESPGSRIDCKNLRIRPELWLQNPRRHGDAFFMPEGSYVLTTAERKEFLEIIEDLKTPTNYAGNLASRVSDGKLRYMKSHDFHVLMQQVNTH
jgi:hypothetical protein